MEEEEGEAFRKVGSIRGERCSVERGNRSMRHQIVSRGVCRCNIRARKLRVATERRAAWKVFGAACATLACGRDRRHIRAHAHSHQTGVDARLQGFAFEGISFELNLISTNKTQEAPP